MKMLGSTMLLLGMLSFSAPAAEEDPNGVSLTGTWRIRVTIPAGSSACPPGGAACVFLALATASSDGTVMQTAALPATSTGHGVWKRIGLRRFRTSTTYFRLDAGGNLIGTAETESVQQLNRAGTEATGTYVNAVYDLRGVKIGEFSATVRSTRLVE